MEVYENGIPIDSDIFEAVILGAFERRASGKYDEAIAAVERFLPVLHKDCLVHAYYEIFRTAEELGADDLALTYALKIAEIDITSFPRVSRFMVSQGKYRICH